MDPDLFAAFVVVDFMLVITPGADWAYAIAAGARGGEVVPAVAGLAVGHLLHATLVVIGVGALLVQSEHAIALLTYLGAAYLLWLGARAARALAPMTAGSPGAVSVARGVATSGLNPKSPLLFFALLPQFVASTAPWPITAQLAVLGSVHVAACAVVYLAVAVTSRRLSRSRPRAAQLVGRASGVAMIAVAVALVIERAMAA